MLLTFDAALALLQLRVSLLTNTVSVGYIALQVYALYERSVKILIFMLVWCAIEVGLMAVLAGLTFSHLKGNYFAHDFLLNL